METRTSATCSQDLLSHSAWVRALAGRLVSDTAQADDLAQDTLLAALERPPGNGGSLKPWLATVLRQRLAFWRRGEANRRSRERERAAREALPSSDELLERAELMNTLVQTVAGLREPYRSVLFLRFQEGLEPREIARRRGVPPATVRSQLKRGLDELRAELDRRFDGDRRRWAVALVPLAGEAPKRGFSLGLAGLTTGAAAALVAVALWARGPGAEASAPPGTEPSSPAVSQAIPAGLVPPSVDPELARTPTTRTSARTSAALPVPATVPSQEVGARFSGRLLDRTSGEPIPGYAIGVQAGDGSKELVWTDVEGHFESSRDHAAGRLLLTYTDHPALDGLKLFGGSTVSVARTIGSGVEFDPAHGPYELRTTVGPTYPLALAAPLPWREREWTASLRAAEGPLYEPRPTSWSLRAPVRHGRDLALEGEPWVRFQPHYGTLPPDRPWLLSVESTDGLWGGEALVQPGEGRSAQPVPIELAARAALEVELVSAALLKAPVVTLEAVSDGVRRTMFPIENEATGGALRFELGALPADDYRVLVRASGAESAALTLFLPAGERTRRAVEVGAADPAAHVRGELQSDSGTFREVMDVRLLGDSVWSLQPEWVERGGRWVAPFAFENLPPGDYAVQLSSRESHLTWRPSPLSVSPPVDGLVVTCQDRVGALDLQLRIHLPGNRDFLPAVGLVAVPDSPTPVTMLSSGRPDLRVFHYKQLPVGAALDWFAWAEGFAPRWGDEQAVELEDERSVIDVTLEAGWGGRLTALELGGAPLGGVEVRLDGLLAATTDERGQAFLAAPAEPGRVELLAEGLVFDQGDYDPEAGRLTGDLGLHVVRFSRRE